MSAILPHPLLSAALGLSWLALDGAASAATWLTAGLVALLIPQVMRALTPERARLRAPSAALRFLGRVLLDALRSNLDVAAIVLRPGRGARGPRRAGFVHVPLDLRDRFGLAALAVALTSIPGTIWVDYDSAGNRLLLHVIDLDGERDWATWIKDRYERPLMEIFS